MQKDTTTKGTIVGLDLSDKVSSYAVLEDGKVTLGKVETTAPALKKLFKTITRAGDVYLRKLLVQNAHYTLGHFGPDSKLRRWGLKLAGEGSSARKKRAIVAVARKLAVLLHRPWVTGEVYEPFHGEPKEVAA